MPTGKRSFQITIGPEDGKSYLIQKIDAPADLWDRWYEFKFHFKIGDNSHHIAHAVVTPQKMIYVKERWYHRLLNFLYLKFYRPKNNDVGIA